MLISPLLVAALLSIAVAETDPAASSDRINLPSESPTDVTVDPIVVDPQPSPPEIGDDQAAPTVAPTAAPTVAPAAPTVPAPPAPPPPQPDPAASYACVLGSSLPEWSEWTYPHKEWCCQNKGVMCETTGSTPLPQTEEAPTGYDCALGPALPAWSEWAVPRKQWCCQYKGVMCATTAAPQPATQPLQQQSATLIAPMTAVVPGSALIPAAHSRVVVPGHAYSYTVTEIVRDDSEPEARVAQGSPSSTERKSAQFLGVGGRLLRNPLHLSAAAIAVCAAIAGGVGLAIVAAAVHRARQCPRDVGTFEQVSPQELVQRTAE